jgi:hypothetical protein
MSSRKHTHSEAVGPLAIDDELFDSPYLAGQKMATSSSLNDVRKESAMPGSVIRRKMLSQRR